MYSSCPATLKCCFSDNHLLFAVERWIRKKRDFFPATLCFDHNARLPCLPEQSLHFPGVKIRADTDDAIAPRRNKIILCEFQGGSVGRTDILMAPAGKGIHQSMSSIGFLFSACTGFASDLDAFASFSRSTPSFFRLSICSLMSCSTTPRIFIISSRSFARVLS